MKGNQVLQVELFSYWQAGTGRGSGAHVDNLSHTDADGLPEIPGRTLKGILRDATRTAGLRGWLDDAQLHQVLFGARAEEAGASQPGCLRVGSAQLPSEERRWLAEAGRDCVPELFRDLHSTSIDPNTGTARAHSLRGIQVVIPLVLSARIAELDAAPAGWVEQLRRCLPLVRAVGSSRSRGLGRARLTLLETADA
ncbi:MAG: RAMP superfamily CRISPR-associated protein [Wenzhouxiangellaceae bacterium]|nr:RAMP superfamily CRISPR-associated protein [Wenzhouxiangellaceae bacterium]